MSRRIRSGGGDDVAACYDVYLDAVHNGTAPLYTPEQAAAWAPPEDPGDWLKPRLDDGRTWIAETGGRADGFLTVTRGGHLDLFLSVPNSAAPGSRPGFTTRCFYGPKTSVSTG